MSDELRKLDIARDGILKYIHTYEINDNDLSYAIQAIYEVKQELEKSLWKYEDREYRPIIVIYNDDDNNQNFTYYRKKNYESARDQLKNDLNNGCYDGDEIIGVYYVEQISFSTKTQYNIS